MHDLGLNKIVGTCTPNVIDGVFPDWVWHDVAGNLLDYNGTFLPSCSKYRGSPNYRVMPVIIKISTWYKIPHKKQISAKMIRLDEFSLEKARQRCPLTGEW